MIYPNDYINKVICGNCLDVLKGLPDESVHCCVTSPPYWGLRDYGIPPQIWGGDPGCEHEWGEQQRTINSGGGWCDPDDEEKRRSYGMRTRNQDHIHTKEVSQGAFCQKCGAWLGSFGLEPTPELYTEHAVMIFREVRRVLKKDGTLWLNLGDSYATGAGKVGDCPGGGEQGKRWRDPTLGYRGNYESDPKSPAKGPSTQPNRMPIPGLKPKDLVGIPWRVAFALQEDGWYLRCDIIWHKPNPMPESVKDRPTKAHEYLFLMSKSERYYYDAEAIKEPQVEDERRRRLKEQERGLDTRYSLKRDAQDIGQHQHGANGVIRSVEARHHLAKIGTRNRRSVWTVSTKPFSGAHFATFPQDLIEPMILAGCPERGVVIDPFVGSGTVARVAVLHRREFIGIELNPEYVAMADERKQVASMMF